MKHRDSPGVAVEKLFSGQRHPGIEKLQHARQSGLAFKHIARFSKFIPLHTDHKSAIELKPFNT